MLTTDLPIVLIIDHVFLFSDQALNQIFGVNVQCQCRRLLCYGFNKLSLLVIHIAIHGGQLYPQHSDHVEKASG